MKEEVQQLVPDMLRSRETSRRGEMSDEPGEVESASVECLGPCRGRGGWLGHDY